MASASNLPPPTTATTSTTTRPFTTTTAGTTTAAKSPVRHQAPPQASSFPIYHLYPSQNLPIRPQAQTPNPNSIPTMSQQQQQPQMNVYPVASSGRGFMARPVRPPDQTVTVANNPNFNHSRGPGVGLGVGVGYRPVIGSPRSHPHLDSSGLTHHHNIHHHLHNHHPTYHPVQLMRQHPTHSPHQQQHHQQHYVTGAALAPPIKGIPVAGPVKASSSPMQVPDSNGYKNTRDKSRDDNLVTIRDRKVKISEGASLYALCRSWLRNGFPEENQPQYGDFVKVLPRPLPMSDVDAHSPVKADEKEVEEAEENEESVDNLSTQDILARHIKRAKKVRARLREQRLKRIARYKTRLAMLLPPQVEQFRNDAVGGN